MDYPGGSGHVGRSARDGSKLLGEIDVDESSPRIVTQQIDAVAGEVEFRRTVEDILATSADLRFRKPAGGIAEVVRRRRIEGPYGAELAYRYVGEPVEVDRGADEPAGQGRRPAVVLPSQGGRTLPFCRIERGAQIGESEPLHRS